MEYYGSYDQGWDLLSFRRLNAPIPARLRAAERAFDIPSYFEITQAR